VEMGLHSDTDDGARVMSQRDSHVLYEKAILEINIRRA
jgi:hypothetical protein